MWFFFIPSHTHIYFHSGSLMGSSRWKDLLYALPKIICAWDGYSLQVCNCSIVYQCNSCTMLPLVLCNSCFVQHCSYQIRLFPDVPLFSFFFFFYQYPCSLLGRVSGPPVGFFNCCGNRLAKPFHPFDCYCIKEEPSLPSFFTFCWKIILMTTVLLPNGQSESVISRSDSEDHLKVFMKSLFTWYILLDI